MAVSGTLSDIPTAKDMAVIINVGTKWVSTLALMSALRFLAMPVILIDCDSTDGSLDHFDRLQSQHQFSIVTLPLRPHGQTLDFVYSELRADRIWLLDSDAEILGSAIVDMMLAGLDDERTFGAGFTHGPAWLTQTQTGYPHERVGLYAERMWIPFTALKRTRVMQALSAGRSFQDSLRFNEIPQIPALAKLLHQRFKVVALNKLRLDALRLFRRIYGNERPHYVYSDTGGDIYEYLKRDLEHLFCGFDAKLAGPYISHFHGITRARLNSLDTNATSVSSVQNIIADRLRVYGFDGVNPGEI